MRYREGVVIRKSAFEKPIREKPLNTGRWREIEGGR